MERRLGRSRLTLERGDITKHAADALVNAANSSLLPGGGVDGAIHRAGGPSIAEQCAKLDGCATGDAKATGAGDLAARHVIHAVGPVWGGGSNGEDAALCSAYRRCLEVAEELGCRSVAFPSLSTGAYGFPIDRASRLALRTVVEALAGPSSIERVTFVLFSDGALQTYERALQELDEGGPRLEGPVERG